MKVKLQPLLREMKERGLTNRSMARQMDVCVAEAEKLMNGEAVGENTARAFIVFFGADKASELIDWDAIGKVNPLACEADSLPTDGKNTDDDEM